jgi:DNA polymerase
MSLTSPASRRLASTPTAFDALVGDVAACLACHGVRHTHALSSANGPPHARAVFVAEAPGRRGAAVTGIPLTRDEAGRRFDAFLALAGLRRDEIFVTNALLCHPATSSGHNRAPARSELARCRPFLARTLDLVDAPVVVSLGRVALDTLATIERHGLALAADVATLRAWRGRTLIPLYHPGRQSTLHRSHQQQEDDWRRLGRLLSAVTPSSPTLP